MMKWIFLYVLFIGTAGAWTRPMMPALGSSYTQWTWTGAGGDTNWANPLNWCGSYDPVTSTCPGAGSKPTAGAAVVFNSICQTNSNCSPTLTANESVASITMMSSYVGTITTSTFSLTTTTAFALNAGTVDVTGGTFVASGSFYQSGGTFTGGSNILNFGTGASNNLNFGISGGTFNAGTGAVNILTGAGTGGTASITGGTVNFSTSGNVSVGRTTSPPNITFTAGALTGPPAATIFKLQGLTTTFGTTYTHNSGVVEFGNSGAQTVTGLATTTLYDVKITASGIITLSSNMSIANNLTLTGVGAAAFLNTSTITMSAGNVTHLGTKVQGTSMIAFTSTAPQTYDNTGVIATETHVPGVIMNAGGVAGGVDLKGSMIITGGLTHTGMGTITRSAGGTLTMSSASATVNSTYNAPNTTFVDLILDGGTNGPKNMIITMLKTGALSITGTTNNCVGTAGTLEVTGDITSTGLFCGSTQFEMKGTGDQVINVSGSASKALPGIKINKASGILSFNGAPVITNGHFQHVTVGTGSFTVPASITFKHDSTYLGTSAVTNNGIAWNDVRYNVPLNAAIWTINDAMSVVNLYSDGTSTTNSGQINGNTISVTGNVTCTTGRGVSGTATIKFTGTGAQALTSTAATAGYCYWPNMEFAGTGANVVTITGFHKYYNTVFKHTSGTVNGAANSTVEFANNSVFTVTPGTINFYNVNIFAAQNGTITGSLMKVAGNLVLNSTAASKSLTCSAGGGFEITDGYLYTLGNGFGGACPATFKGVDAGSAYWFKTVANTPTGLVTINKTAGSSHLMYASVAPAANLSFAVTSGRLELYLTNFAISGTGTLTLAAGTSVKLNGYTLSVGGVTIPAGAYSGGTVVP